jgi:hypothetical protein
VRKFFIGFTACLLSLTLLGCQPSTKTDNAPSKSDNNTPAVIESGVNSELSNKQKPNSEANNQANEPKKEATAFTDNQAEVIAMKTAAAVLKSVQAELWPEAKFDTILLSRPMIHKDNDFYPWNTGYSKDLEVEAFAIGNQGDYSKMQVIYVDAFGKVINNQFFEAKITAKVAEEIALEAAKKARETVPYWKDAKIEHRETSLALCTPNYVFSLDNFNKETKPVAAVMYEVCFRDSSATSSFLFIYVDAATGNILGAKYGSD